MGVLIEVVGVSIPVCGFHLFRCWYCRFRGFHTGNEKSRRGRRSSQRGFRSRFIRNNRERCGRCGGSMRDGSLVHRVRGYCDAPSPTACTETIILAVSITINLGRGQRNNCIHRRRDGMIDRSKSVSLMRRSGLSARTQPLLQEESPPQPQSYCAGGRAYSAACFFFVVVNSIGGSLIVGVRMLWMGTFEDLVS